MPMRMIGPDIFDLVERMKAQRLYDNMKYRQRLAAAKEALVAKAAVDAQGVGE